MCQIAYALTLTFKSSSDLWLIKKQNSRNVFDSGAAYKARCFFFILESNFKCWVGCRGRKSLGPNTVLSSDYGPQWRELRLLFGVGAIQLPKERASTFKHPEEHNSLCLCTISFSIDREMNADVVCHSLKLCKQDPGQPLCHLYPPPKVSCFFTFFKATDCGRSFKLELNSTEASSARALSGK